MRLPFFFRRSMSCGAGPCRASSSPFSIASARLAASWMYFHLIPSRYAFPLFAKNGVIDPG